MGSRRGATSATTSQQHFTGQLVRGLKGPGGVSIRLARSGEAQRISELAAAEGRPPSPALLHAVEDGSAGSTLLTHMRAPARNENLRLMTDAVYRADLAILHGLSLPLVAEQEGRIVGELTATAPIGFIGQLADSGMAPVRAVSAAMAMVKITSLAVAPEARGTGIATALLSAANRAYDCAGYIIQLASTAREGGLEHFYTGRGFDLVPLGESISLWVIYGQDIRFTARSSELLLTRTRYPSRRHESARAGRTPATAQSS